MELVTFEESRTINALNKQMKALLEENPEAAVSVAHVSELIDTMKANRGAPRGTLAGIPITEMTDDQLKREIINAKSVLYKASQRNANPDIIERNQARVEAALAERDARKAIAGTPEVNAAIEVDASEEEVYDATEL